MAHEIFWEEKGILIKFSGIVTQEEVHKIKDTIYRNGKYDTIKYQISDYSNVAEIILTTFDANILGILGRQSTRWNRWRVRNAIVTRDAQFIPIVNSYLKEMESTDWENRIFETLEKAYEWVNEDENKFKLLKFREN